MIEIGETYDHEKHGAVKVTSITKEILRVDSEMGREVEGTVIEYSYEKEYRRLARHPGSMRVHGTDLLENFIESVDEK